MNELSITRDVQMLATGVLGAFAVFHLLLYLQNRSVRSNLVFSGALVCAAVATFFDFQTNFVPADLEMTMLRVQRVASMAWGVLLYVLVLALFDRPFGREGKILVVCAVLVAGVVAVRPVEYLPLGYAGTLVIAALLVRHLTRAVREERPNAKTLATGVGLLLAGAAYDMVLDAFFPDVDLAITNGYPFGIMAFLVATSWALGRDTAATQKRLEAEEQARALSERELARRQADMADARRLQQSFLPSDEPGVRWLDVAFRQSMAMEVGGDYYDYHRLGDDVLLLAVGDATGHGTRGSLMVAVVKSLFQTADVSRPPDEILREASVVIKAMSLQSMFMGLSVVRIEAWLESSHNGGSDALADGLLALGDSWRRQVEYADDITIAIAQIRP